MFGKRNLKPILFFGLCSFITAAATAQTFDVSGQQSKKPGKSTAQRTPGQQGPGSFGTSIGVARLARGADDALKHGNPTLAATYAKQATEAAPGNPQLWFLYGYSARLANRLGESEQAYLHGLKLQPGAPDGLSGMAQTYDKQGRTEDAKKLLMQVVNAHPERTNDMLLAGELFMRTNDLQRGLGILQQAERRKPSAHSELLMAIAYMKLKQPDKAKQMLALARRTDPKNTDIFRAVANFQREEKDYPGAIATLQSVPSKKPDVLADLAYTYELAGDLKASATTWERVAGMAPGNIGYQLNAGQAQLRLSDITKAKQYVRRAAAINSDHYRVHALKASIAREEKHPEDAIREYNLALARIPESVPEGVLYPIQLRLNLSELYKQIGRDAEAKQQIALAEQQVNKLQIEGPARAEFLRVRASIRASDNTPEALRAAEQDLAEAMKLDPKNTAVQLQYANLLWREKRNGEAQNIYLAVLQQDPKNRYALEGMGYLKRDEQNFTEAESYFHMLASAYPDDYVPYLALGDMYTSMHRYEDALAQYDKGYALQKENTAIIANAANAALELHKMDVAKVWLDRSNTEMDADARIMRQRERYLFYKGDYNKSAELGYAVLKQLPNDRNASVYLAYDLYNMGRRDDVLALASKYENIIDYEPNFPLLEGHVHRQSQLLDQSVSDYTRAIARDKNMVEAYVNRGYVYNDQQNAEAALKDFDQALKIQPENGIALLGRSFSSLELKRSADALRDAELARKAMGDSGAVELALATGNRQLRRLGPAETHYKAALGYAPNDITLWLALADTYYEGRHFNDSITALNQAIRLDAHDPLIYAELAHNYAQLRQRDNTISAIQRAESEGGDQSAVLLATGDAMLTLGDRKAAMQRFGRALNAPDANRVDVRLALARLFASERRFDDAKEQISLGFSDARIGESSPVSADNMIEAGNIVLSMHDYDLAWKFYDRARQAGAPEDAVALGEANTYLALGDSRHAEAALAMFGNPADNVGNYDYQLAMANYYQQKNDLSRSMVAYARANRLSTDPNDLNLLDSARYTAAQHGINLTRDLTVASDTSFAPIFEDSNIYALDAQLLSTGANNRPPPRANYEIRQTTGFRYAPDGWVPISAFWQVRNARGTFSFPALNQIIKRNTTDTTFAGGLNPVLHMGEQRISFNGGLQFTLRRDSESPIQINENLLRPYLFVETSPLFNWITIRANGFRESGPFTLEHLNSKEYFGKIEFQVGRPWNNTSLVTGYTADDLQFRPLIREFFSTSTYAGLQHKFGQRLTVTGLAEIVRSWRVQDTTFATAQSIAPGGNVEARIRRNWSLNAFGTYQSNKTVGLYDNVQSGFYISYTRPFSQTVNDGFGAVPVEFPIKFSFGFQEESFMNFKGTGQTTVFRPVIRLTLF